ncbi:MAG TPA: MBL fold metallo-hydrolase [Candidatus Binataceae bacterium]|nr:MBL fold metallo-hydrolase [Candidatus Binataceae bacterium]
MARPRSRWRWVALTASVALVACVVWLQVPFPALSEPTLGAPLLNPAAWTDDAITMANLGHATLLMNFDGVRVISDPALFYRVGLSLGPLGTIGPHRLIAPALPPNKLQAIDVIVITHAHMDHLDLPSLKALPKTATVVACTGCGDLIRPLGFNDVRELNWGESTSVKGLTVTALGARHWGKRWPPLGRAYGFNSYVLDKEGHRMLLACDSASTDLFAALKTNPPEIAAFSIGAYDPWIWNHANPEQVWQMFQGTGAEYLVPIHWGTFRLSKEPRDEPMKRLLAAAGIHADEVVERQIGVAWKLPMISRSNLQRASK